jgi:hypothetical protein
MDRLSGEEADAQKAVDHNAQERKERDQGEHRIILSNR